MLLLSNFQQLGNKAGKRGTMIPKRIRGYR